MLHDLEELCDARNGKQVVVLVLMDRTQPWDGSSNSNTRLYEVKTGKLTLLADWGEMNMGDPKTLSKFVGYAFNYSAAPNRAVILSDHGMSWKGVCRDYTSANDCLTLAELSTAFQTVKTYTGKTASLIGFDACIMGYLEVAFQLRSYCSVMVGSEEVEWTILDSNPSDGYYGGWPLDGIVSELNLNPTMTPENLGSVIVNEYAQFWEPDQQDYEYYAMSAIRTSVVGSLTHTVNYLGANLPGLLPTYWAQLSDLRRDTTSFYHGDKELKYADLYDFCELLRTTGDIIIGRGLSIICGDVIAYISEAVIAEWHSSAYFITNAHGIGIYFPNCDATYESDYSALSFCTDTVNGAPEWKNWLIAFQD
jgi:hypothetical protein